MSDRPPRFQVQAVDPLVVEAVARQGGKIVDTMRKEIARILEAMEHRKIKRNGAREAYFRGMPGA